MHGVIGYLLRDLIKHDLGSHGGARKEGLSTISPRSLVENHAWEPVPLLHAQPSSRLPEHRAVEAWSGSCRCL